MVIRSLVATRDGERRRDTPRTWRYELGTGGGVTVRSDLAEEWEETRWKAARVQACLAP